MLQDIKYGLRILLRAPVVTAAAVLTLGLGIGANTAIFSVVEATLLRPLPFPGFDRLVQVERRFGDFLASNISIPQYVFWRDHSESFEVITAYDWLEIGFNLTGQGDPIRFTGTRVTATFFETFGVGPDRGRSFNSDEHDPGGPLAVILSDGLWRDAFGSSPDIVGQSLMLNGRQHDVVGVMPPGFRYPATAQLWVPLQMDAANADRQAYLQVTGRLRPGVSATQAMAETTAVNEEFLREFGTVADDEVVAMRSPQEMLFGDLRTTFQIIAAITGFVLLIACGNVASLQLTRSAERSREIALRRSLGAPTARIVRQLVTEALLLATLGGALGVAIAIVGLQLTAQLVPAANRPLAQPALSGVVLAFIAAVTLGVGIVTGLVPALRAFGRGASAGLRLDSQRSITGSGGRVRQVVVAAQVALTVVALVGAGLFIRSFLLLVDRDAGFESTGVMTAHMPMAAARYDGPEDWQELADRLIATIAALPGVESATAATNLPMANAPGMTFLIDGAPPPETDDDIPGGHYRPGTTDYFETFGIRIVRGRGFADTDRQDSAGVVVINEEAERLFWPDSDPLGAQITIGPPIFPPPFHDTAPRTVIGIANDVLEDGLAAEVSPVIYIPLGQVPPALMQRYVSLLPLALAVRTSGAPAQIVGGMRGAVLEFDPNQPLTDVQTLDSYLAGTVSDRRTTARLLSAFAGLALFLAMVGVYGVASYAVQQRTREIGVRVALGAGKRHIRGMVMAQSLFAVAAGIGVGIGAALLLGRFAASLVFGITTSDPATLIAVPAVLLLVAGAAVLLPVARALRIDPASALREP